MNIKQHIKWADKGGDFNLRRLFVWFCLSTLVAVAIISIYAKVSGKLNNGYSPNTATGAFLLLLFMAVPNNIIGLILIYLIYYLIVVLFSAYIKGFPFITALFICSLIYLYLVQLVLVIITGNITSYSFLLSFKQMDFSSIFITITYIIQINISHLITKRRQIV